MRNLRNPQLERGEVRIEDIELDIKSRGVSSYVRWYYPGSKP